MTGTSYLRIYAAGLIAWACTSCPLVFAESRAILAITYQPAEGELKVVLEDGTALIHSAVPVKLGDAFLAAENDVLFYEENITPHFPAIDAEPVDEAYIARIAEAPPGVLRLCKTAMDHATGRGQGALEGIDRLTLRAEREGDNHTVAMSISAKNIILSSNKATREAHRRFGRKEYDQAHQLMSSASRSIQQLMASFTARASNVSSVSIRDHHEASHFISAYSSWLDISARQLEVLREKIEPLPVVDGTESG